MSIPFKTYRGIWLKPNLFLIENGPSIYIAPYQNLTDEYRSKLPMDCFILVESKYIVKDVVEIIY